MVRPLAPVTPDVVRRQVVLEEVDVAPDAASAVVVRRTVAGLEYRRALWLVPLARDLEGGRRRGVPAPRRLTSGLPADTHPRFAPDGRTIAFLSARPGAAPGTPVAHAAPGPSGGEPEQQVWVLPAEGAEPWCVTRSEHGVQGFAWSPDGRRIAYWGPDGPARLTVGERPGRTPTARRIVSGGWRMDEAGYQERRTHLFLTSVRPGARARRLTGGDFDVLAPAWDADGRSLVFCAARHERADLYPRPRVFRVTADGRGEPVEVVRLPGLVESAVPSPDGRWLALTGLQRPDATDDESPSLFVVAADGAGAPCALAPDLDLPVGPMCDTDLHGWGSSPRSGPFWVREAAGSVALVALTTRRGRCVPWRYPLDPERGEPAGPPTPLVDDESACWQLAVGGSGAGRPFAAPTIVALGTLAGRAMELMAVEDRRFRTLTSMGSAWQRRHRQPAMADLEIAGPLGPIETWLASPPDAGSAPLPLVVDIHGGPSTGGWAPAPSLEVQMLVSVGYRVALPNIHGSGGYGARWIRDHMGRWGEVDAADILAVVDHLVAAGLADPDRVGLLGLSYGGFLVNWLVGAAPGRFAAAVSEAGVTNQVAAWALSDTGPDYNLRYGLGDPLTPEGVELLWRQSPLRHVAAIRTPLLLLQGEADQRCPAADNEQLFVALRALGRTVEYVLYPESHHVYAVNGRPDRRVDRHARMLAWFARYLAPAAGPVAGASDTEPAGARAAGPGAVSAGVPGAAPGIAAEGTLTPAFSSTSQHAAD